MVGACSHRLCLVPEACPFDCIAITAPNPRASQAYLDELVRRVGGRGTKEMLILAVSDPKGVRIGSGGGTLNAVLEIDQALRQAKPCKGADPQAGGLAAARVLLVHSGGDSQRSPTQCVCGKAWSALNSCSRDKENMCNTPMDLLLDHLSRLFGSGLAAGTLVVTACDVMLLVPPEVAATADWSFDESGGVAGLAIAADAEKYAPNHGVYCLDGGAYGEGKKHAIARVGRYLQKPSVEVAKASGAFLPPKPSDRTSENGSENLAAEVAIDSGVVVFSGPATIALRGLAFSDAFKGCTARGVAAGAAALRLELYSDLLLALKTGSAEQDDGGLDAYLEACGPALPADHALSKARRETWDALRGFPLGGMLLTGATFVHLGTTPELMEMMTLRLPDFIEPYGLTARAASVVGNACTVEEDPPAVIVNSSLGGAGVVAGGAVVEHCRLQGDGWEIGAGSLVSGIRSVKADYKLRLRSGMCLQQTDLDSGAEEQPQMQEGAGKAFVVSLFGARDDIKTHYTAERARICGATWKAFLAYAGASVEDVWGGVAEADRKLWSARLFPVLRQEGHAAAAADAVLWMQDVEGHASSCSSSSSPPEDVQSKPATGTGLTTSSAEATKTWLAAERLSFKEILARADPCAEFKWRKHLEEGMEKNQPPSKEGHEVGGGRFRAWDAIGIVTATMDELHQARRSVVSSAGLASTLCVPPPHPTASSATTAPAIKEGRGGDGPLILNAILVVVERYSALKRARFGSETSAAALRGMCVLLCFAGGAEEEAEQRARTIQSGVPTDGGPVPQGGSVWVLQRDGSVFVIEEKSIAPLLALYQSRPQYQCLTYLGADNAMPAPATAPQSPATRSVAAVSTLDFMTAAAAAASTSLPKLMPPVSEAKHDQEEGHPAYSGRAPTTFARWEVPDVPCLKELDEQAADKACTPARAAQALARIACRLYDLADALGGGGHRSGPGEHPDWQAAMRGLDTLSPLPGVEGWGAPAALPGSVAALKSLRQSWLGVTGVPCSGNSSPASPGNEESDNIDADVLPFADPHLVVRCARHYERAAALVVSAAVMTASLFVENPPPRWEIATREAAAVDLSLLPGQIETAAVKDSNAAAAAERGVVCSISDGASNAGGHNDNFISGSVPEQQGQQQLEQQQQVSSLTPRQQDMARHMQGHINHQNLIRENAQRTREQEQEEKQQQQQEREREQQERISSLTPRQQDMARHMQVHINHRNIVREHAERTRERRQEEKHRWDQQQQQPNHLPREQLQQEALPVGACVTSRAAARIDVAGGWTDTPPISYEAGGAVVNMAVTISGERPVEARCERIEASCVELVCESSEGAMSIRTICSSLQDFADFCVPQAPAALLKAALICAGIVTLPSAPPSHGIDSATSSADIPAHPSLQHTSLQTQLAAVFGSGGIRITSRSGLPQGSGMGTSSILAGVVLSAACVAAGRSMSSKSLVHAVLRVEQLMTAGGGHQDQVGGLLGGMKICSTTANLPLQVLIEPIALDGAFEDALNDRLVLVFTGKQRLARDLLQGVVRGWHDRLPGTVNTVRGLVSNAEEAANACRGAGDLPILGRCLSTYWEQKKRMAPGAEPPAVRYLLEKLRPLCHGLSVCGAGGGGFVACITKSPGDKGIEEVTNALASASVGSPEVSNVTIHRGRLDPEGMEVSVDLPHP